MIADVAVQIVQREEVPGRPFSDILYTFTEGGAVRNACTRLWHPIADTLFERANQIEAFKRRQAKPWE